MRRDLSIAVSTRVVFLLSLSLEWLKLSSTSSRFSSSKRMNQLVKKCLFLKKNKNRRERESSKNVKVPSQASNEVVVFDVGLKSTFGS